jgi:DNA ligase (NAD+)
VKLNGAVTVRRAGDVIPEITGGVEGAGGEDIQLPTECPSCGSKLETKWPFLYCVNHDECPAQQIRKWIHFGSRGAMDIATFSSKTAEQLSEAGLLTSFPDLFRLTLEDLLPLDRFGIRKAEKLLQAIESSKSCKWDKFLYSLGIKYVGEGTSQRLSKAFPNWESLKNASIEELISVNDIGEETAAAIYEWLQTPVNRTLVEELFAVGINPEQEVETISSTKLDDKTFVITGTLSQSRDYFTKLVEENGGKVSKGVSSNTDYLLAGEKAGSKRAKAESLNVKIIGEDEFLKMIS